VPFTNGEIYNINSGAGYDSIVNRMGNFNGDGKAEIDDQEIKAMILQSNRYDPKCKL